MKVLVQALLVAASYYILALAGLSIVSHPSRSSVVWPSAGIALGAVYTWGPRLLPGVWLGAFLASMWVVPQFGQAVIPASAATVAAWAGAWIMHKALRPPWIFSPLQLLAFFVICWVAAPINGVSAPLLLGLEPLDSQIKTWVIGDAVGACLFAPLVVFLEHQARENEQLKMTVQELVEGMLDDS